MSRSHECERCTDECVRHGLVRASLTLGSESFPICLMRSLLLLICLSPAVMAPAQTVDADRTQFDGHCAGCHGKQGNGGELGPAIVMRLANYNDGELATLIHTGLPNSGMPAA